jgi:hypothetical protein
MPFWCPCRRRGLRWRQWCCRVSGAIVAMAHSRYLEALTKRPAMVAVGIEEQGMEREEGGRGAAARRRQAARRELERRGRMDDGGGIGIGGFEVASRAVPSPSPPPPVKGGTHSRPLGLHVPITHHPLADRYLTIIIINTCELCCQVETCCRIMFPHHSTIASDHRFVHLRP